VKIEREQLGSGAMVHRLIAQTAKEICEAVFEACSYTDKFHEMWPEKYRKRFIQRFWAEYIGAARDSLTTLLQPIPGTETSPDGPKYATPQIMRDEIFEALLIDGAYKRPAPLSVDQLRANAGFDPLSDVLKAKHGKVLH
jgi:hypothetical protein